MLGCARRPWRIGRTRRSARAPQSSSGRYDGWRSSSARRPMPEQAVVRVWACRRANASRFAHRGGGRAEVIPDRTWLALKMKRPPFPRQKPISEHCWLISSMISQTWIDSARVCCGNSVRPAAMQRWMHCAWYMYPCWLPPLPEAPASQLHSTAEQAVARRNNAPPVPSLIGDHLLAVPALPSGLAARAGRRVRHRVGESLHVAEAAGAGVARVRRVGEVLPCSQQRRQATAGRDGWGQPSS